MHFSHITRSLIAISFFSMALAAEAAPAQLSGADVAARLLGPAELNSLVRLKMEIKSTETVLQVQIKERRTKEGTDIVYQVLWPKDRKGEAVILHSPRSKAASGVSFTPPNTVKTLDLSQPLFGSDLSCEDAADNIFLWNQQILGGTELVDGVSCQVLDSKPKGKRSSYGNARTWVDLRRFAPVRVEKSAPSGEVIRQIDTTRTTNDDGRTIPANLSVKSVQKGTETLFDGSRIRHDISFTDKDFSPEGLKDDSGKASSAE